MNMKNYLSLRLTAIVAAFFSLSFSALADNVFSIADFSIAAGETKEISLVLNNTDTDLTGINGTITMPEGLSIVANAYGTGTHAQFARNLMIGNLVPSSGKFSGVAGGNIDGTSGAVMTFKVTASDKLAASSTITIAASLDKSGTNVDAKANACTVKLASTPGGGDDPTVDPDPQPTENAVSVSPEKLSLDAEGEGTFQVLLTNKDAFTGFQANVAATDGITITSVVKGDRVSGLGGYTASTGKISYLGSISGNDGALFTVIVKANKDFKGTATVNITNFKLTNKSSQSTKIEDIAYEVTVGGTEPGPGPATEKTIVWDFSDYEEQVVLAGENYSIEYNGLTLVGNDKADYTNDYVSAAAFFHMNGASSSKRRYIEYTPANDGKLTVYYRSNNATATDRITAIGTEVVNFTSAEDAPSTVLAWGFTDGSNEKSISAELKAANKYYAFFATGGQTIIKLEYTYEDVTTGIEAVKTNVLNEGIYNLAGQRVKAAKKGLYIINGKKVLVK